MKTEYRDTPIGGCMVRELLNGKFKITTYANGEPRKSVGRYDSLAEAREAIKMYAEELKAPPQKKPKKEKRGYSASVYLGHVMIQYPDYRFAIVGDIATKTRHAAPLIYSLRDAERYIRDNVKANEGTQNGK